MSHAKQTPPEIEGMVTISRNAFYATVGQLDVHPYPVGNFDPIFGYRSDWKTRNHKVIAATVGGMIHSHARYMVTREFFNANRTTIAKAAGEEQ